jgi:activator of HSP90 ATPase
MMNRIINRAGLAKTSTRRQVIAGAAFAFGGAAAASRTLGQTQPPPTKEAPGTGANQKRTSLHQEIDLKASPQRIYEILLDSKQFAAFTGSAAEVDPKVGGVFSLFGGLIVGRNVELIPNERIVQAWRPGNWIPGVYSIVKFELKPRGSGTLVVLDHTGFPEGDFDTLSSGWTLHYWGPLKKFLA